jgi:hypothetical protein
MDTHQKMVISLLASSTTLDTGKLREIEAGGYHQDLSRLNDG